MDGTPDPWPLWHLVLRTPRLELRPDDDAGLRELMAEACRGVHPPEEMPFGIPWTDAPPAELVRNGMRFYWQQRAVNTSADWNINFMVRLAGQVIGCQSLRAKDFAIRHEVSTGSWIGLRHQGKGIGTEMRAAVLILAFDHLRAHTARSAAYVDNAQSNAVSRKLGYEPDGTFTDVRRGKPATQTRLKVTKENFHRPPWPMEIAGLAEAKEFLDVDATQPT